MGIFRGLEGGPGVVQHPSHLGNQAVSVVFGWEEPPEKVFRPHHEDTSDVKGAFQGPQDQRKADLAPDGKEGFVSALDQLLPVGVGPRQDDGIHSRKHPGLHSATPPDLVFGWRWT